MQDELDAQQAALGIRLFGVNQAGYEDGNSVMTDGRTLPWLQDTAASDAWGRWGVEYRDVVVVDEAGYPVAVYNLSYNDLATEANYAALWELLITEATDED